MEDKKCLICGCSLPEKLRNYKKNKYCSKKCVKENAKNNYQKRNPVCGVDAIVIGTINEYKTIIELLSKNFLVYKSCGNYGCDLMAFKDEKLFRIEVTTGHYSTSGKILRPTKDHQKFDILAIVMTDGKIIYEPELPT